MSNRPSNVMWLKHCKQDVSCCVRICYKLKRNKVSIPETELLLQSVILFRFVQRSWQILSNIGSFSAVLRACSIEHNTSIVVSCFAMYCWKSFFAVWLLNARLTSNITPNMAWISFLADQYTVSRRRGFYGPGTSTGPTVNAFLLIVKAYYMYNVSYYLY